MEHTKEPWGQIDIDGQVWNASHILNAPIDDDVDENIYLVNETDYCRAIVCTDACAGIEHPEAIPAVVKALHSLLNDKWTDYEQTRLDAIRAALAALEGKG